MPLEVLYFIKGGNLFLAINAFPFLAKKNFLSNGRRVFFLAGNGANNANYLVGFF